MRMSFSILVEIVLPATFFVPWQLVFELRLWLWNIFSGVVLAPRIVKYWCVGPCRQLWFGSGGFCCSGLLRWLVCLKLKHRQGQFEQEALLLVAKSKAINNTRKLSGMPVFNFSSTLLI